MNMPILYEDESLLVVDKPAGVVVNRADSVKGETVEDWAEKYIKVLRVPKGERGESTTGTTGSTSTTGSLGNLSNYSRDTRGTYDSRDTFHARSGVVHRLDKETSGCLIIAKTPQAFVKLQQAFKDRLVKKTYIALVHGDLVPQEGEIRAPVGRLPWNRERFGVVPGGKEAVTKYKVLNHYSSSGAKRSREVSLIKNVSSRLRSNNKYTLVELYPESGRTHQIRVHLKYINHPIVADYLYAGRKVQKQDRIWCPRVFLHASKIEFTHPETEKLIKVESPLPKDLKSVLNNLTIVSSLN